MKDYKSGGSKLYIKYTLERHLKEICENNKEYVDLYASWEISKKIYAKMLSTILYNYPTYSLHDGSHSKNIISSIEMLLGEKRIELLGPTETWMVLQLAYLHDIGMILPDYLVREEWIKDDFQEYIINATKLFDDEELRIAAEYIIKIKENLSKQPDDKLWPLEVRRYVTILVSNYFRSRHAKLSQKYIKGNNFICNNVFANDIIQKRLFNLISEISFLHGENVEAIMDLDYITNGYKSDYIHPRFLAKLIRIGDLLDTDNDRFNDTLCKVYGNLPYSSQNHYKKHKAIEHLLITPDVIEIRANCEEGEVYRETRRWFEWLETEIEHFAIEWNDIVPRNFTDSAPKVKKLEILLKGKRVEREDIDLKFKFEQKEAFELLEGSGIYDHKLDFLRELIQNALDVTKIQFWKDLKEGLYDSFIKNKKENEEISYKDLNPFDFDAKVYENYKVAITAEEDRNGDVAITVEDRGIGIGKNDLNYISKPGQSWDKRENYKKDLKNMPLWLRPTGGFGIGLHSCFRISDEITIYTKTNLGKGKKIILKSPKQSKGYFYVEDNLGKNKRGTKVVVKITKEESAQLTTYSMGGHVDNKIKRTDPFKYEHKIKGIDFIKEYLLFKNLFGSTLFEIVFNKEIQLSQCLGQKIRFDEKDGTYKEYDNCYYKYDDKMKSIVLWDSKNYILCKASLKNYNYGLYQEVDYKFKGIDVKLFKNRNYDFNTNSWIYEFDFYGFSTKEYLTLNRKNVVKDKTEEVIDIINKRIIKNILILFKQKIMTVENHFDEKNIMLPLWLYIDFRNNEVLNNEKDKEFYLEKFEVLEKYSLKKIKKENEKYEITYGTWKQFLNEYPKVNIINGKELEYYSHGQITPNKLSDDELCSIINLKQCVNVADEIWIVQESIFDSLFKNYAIKKLQKIKTNKLCSDRNFLYDRYINVFTFIDERKKIQNPLEVDEETKKIILNSLIEKDIIRNAVPGIKEYDKLIVKNYPFGVHYQSKNKIYYNDNYIISPLTSQYEEIIKTCQSQEEIIIKLQDEKEFYNLLKYVQENNISDIKPAISEIKEEYFKLIKDYFKISKKRE